MDSISKGSAVFIILIMAISALSVSTIKLANAQTTIPKPSVPQFTLKFVNNSYLVPEATTYTTNPYTGKTTSMVTGGYLEKNNTISITIKKQSVPPTINGTATELHFNVRAKGYFEENWTNQNLPSYAENDINPSWLGYLPTQQISDYTVVSIPANAYPAGGIIVIQVRAILGIIGYNKIDYYPYSQSYFEYESSDWSNTQTITIGETSASPLPTPAPTVPEFSALILTPLLAAVLFAIMALKIKSKRSEGF